MAEEFDLEKWKYWCNILSVNSSVLVSNVKWDDVTNALTGLKLCTKDEGYRSEITKDIVEHCRNFIENSHILDFKKCSNIQAGAFRLLRNCCVDSKKNQDYVMSCGLLSTVIKTFEQVLKHNKDCDEDCAKHVLISGIHLLGNLVVQHEKNQEIIWEQCYPSFFIKILRCRYDEAKNFICMVIYNCMRQKPRVELWTTCEGRLLINDIVKICSSNENNIEWGIFIIESLIQNGSFRLVYVGLDSNSHRIFLLELIEYKLKGNRTADYCVSWISVDNALFIAQTFEDNVSRILNSKIEFDGEESSREVILVNSLLRLLCLLTAFQDGYQEIRSRECLLMTSLATLGETSKEENRKYFSDLSQFSNPSDHVTNLTHPAFGFKKNLIQLIANMCYLNTMNQDCVRQMGCIPTLLDHCNIDDYNPYICQWTIFCLRNVLENNLENQQVIRSVTKVGLAHNRRLTEAGFVVEETTDGKLRIVGKHNENTMPQRP